MTTVAVGSLSWIEVGLSCLSGVKRKGESEIDWVKCDCRGLKIWIEGIEVAAIE